jgi:hypothetical protein
VIIVKRNTTIEFEPRYEDYFKELAIQKQKIMLNKNKSIRNWSNIISPATKEMIGIAGEFAASRFLGLQEPDPELIASMVNYDLVFNNLTIDVKCTQAPNPHLAVPKFIADKKTSFANVYFLIQQKSFLKYTFLGSCPTHDLIKPENLGFFPGYKIESYMMKATKLTDFETTGEN